MQFRKEPPTEPGIYEAQTLLGRRRIVVFIPGSALIAFHKDWNVTNREYQPSAYLWGDRIDLDRTPDPNALPADEVERIHKLLDGHVPRADGATCDDSGCQSKLYHRVHLLLEKSPQPVPEHVKETIGNLRSLMSKGEPCGYWYVQVLCDHILPREEPLPLTKWREGKFCGAPMRAHRVQADSHGGWFVQQLDGKHCQVVWDTDLCTNSLNFDGAADA